ncbi:P-loop ATPase, Sll1717 family [Neobacillus piezotolerans]|nr:S1 RNA-binding domain-containing protein [Neobacillus piezotolerans]
MSKESSIREIYMGQLDAKDEISYGTEETFLQCFVAPPNYDINDLISGPKFLINGFKGVGKTALLYYIESICLKEDPLTCTSFILFKSDFKDLEKVKIDSAAKRLIQSINFEQGIMQNVNDFHDLWKIIIFQRIVDDNEENSCNLFINDENWADFSKIVKSIKILNYKQRQISVPNKIKLIAGVTKDGNITSGAEIDFEKDISVKDLTLFDERVKECTRLFVKLKRTDIPYYMFIDELEAFYADENTFKRDLIMLRDLILAIKEINFLIASSEMGKTKLICSIRTEIVNSIYRYIPTKELNKIISGFECKLNWNYTNTNAIEHPLFKILLKRLELTDASKRIRYNNLEEIYNAWFQQNDNSEKVVNYILNSLWNKPRDVIRLISAFKNSTVSNRKFIDQEVMNHSIKEYSNKSLEEICGELNAIYKPDEMEEMLSWIRGFKSPFSLLEFKKRIENFSVDNEKVKRLNTLLEDIYRVGIIGNYNPYLKSHRWQHKSDERVIIDEGWLFVIHNGLNTALSVTKAKKEKNQTDLYNYDSTALKPNEIYDAVVTRIYPNRVIVDIHDNGMKYKGSIHISKVTNRFVRDINEYFNIGKQVTVKVLNYDSLHRSWVLENQTLITN